MRLTAQWCRVGLVVFGLAVVGSTSCKPKYLPTDPVKMAPEGCCKLGNQKMTKFAGCRLTHRCKDDEPIWIRGAVNCTAVDEAKCFGGRCCEFQPLYGTPDSALQWDDDSDKPTGGKPGSDPAPGEAKPEAAPEAKPEAKPDTEPEATPEAKPDAASPTSGDTPKSSDAPATTPKSAPTKPQP